MSDPKSSSTDVLLERPVDEVALVTMSGPHPNLCTFEAVDRLADRLVEAREGGARVVVLASGVPGRWLYHASLRDLHGLFSGGPTSGSGAGFFRAVHELAQSEVVSIAAISGDTAGGGAEIGWACDLRVADECARFAQPEVMLGVVTGLGGTSRLVRLVGVGAAAEMVLDGAPLPARRLHALGALNRVVEDGRCVEVALGWAARLARRPSAALAAQKQLLAACQDLPLGEALADEQRRFQEIARSSEGLERMAAAQARYDAGAAPDELSEEPFEA